MGISHVALQFPLYEKLRLWLSKFSFRMLRWWDRWHYRRETYNYRACTHMEPFRFLYHNCRASGFGSSEQHEHSDCIVDVKDGSQYCDVPS